MTDKEIVNALIERNRFVTRQFFYVNCRPLLTSVINKLFDYSVDYDEFVNELYQLLMEDDARRLRQFDFRSSIYQWLKTVSIRHFAQKRSLLIDNTSKVSPLKTEEDDDVAEDGRDVSDGRERRVRGGRVCTGMRGNAGGGGLHRQHLRTVAGRRQR